MSAVAPALSYIIPFDFGGRQHRGVFVRLVGGALYALNTPAQTHWNKVDAHLGLGGILTSGKDEDLKPFIDEALALCEPLDPFAARMPWDPIDDKPPSGLGPHGWRDGL